MSTRSGGVPGGTRAQVCAAEAWRRAQQRLGGGGEAGGGEAGVARWQRGGGEGGNETETRDERDRETRDSDTVWSLELLLKSFQARLEAKFFFSVYLCQCAQSRAQCCAREFSCKILFLVFRAVCCKREWDCNTLFT